MICRNQQMEDMRKGDKAGINEFVLLGFHLQMLLDNWYGLFFFFKDNLMVIFMLPGKPQIHQVYFLWGSGTRSHKTTLKVTELFWIPAFLMWWFLSRSFKSKVEREKNMPEECWAAALHLQGAWCCKVVKVSWDLKVSSGSTPAQHYRWKLFHRFGMVAS